MAGAVAAGAVLNSSGASGATPRLPARTPAQLLTAIQTSAATAFSGRVSEHANLGLPSLPGDQSSASLSWTTFVTGTHSARVWVDGVDRQRSALIGELSEADVVHNGQDLWTYTSDTNTVTHTVLPRDTGSAAAPDLPLSPSAATDRLLKAITPTTSVRLGANRVVANRSAYTLVIRPKDARSTIREVTIAVDSTRYVPLQLQVFGASSTPAFQIGFTHISYARPSAATFAFHAPAGATVSTNPLTEHRYGHKSRAVQRPRTANSAGGTRVIGSGWTAVLEMRDGLRATAGLPPELQRAATGVGSSGDRLVHTALLNVVITSDGRAFVGAVQPAALEHIAATTPR